MFQGADCRDIKGDKDVESTAQPEGESGADGKQEESELDMGPCPDCGLVLVMHGRH